MTKLEISIVVHDWSPEVLFECLRALSRSIDKAHVDGQLAAATLWLSYNGRASLDSGQVESEVLECFGWPFHLLLKQPNLGYGGTNNLIINRHMLAESSSDCAERRILVMNPDVAPEVDAISHALLRLRGNAHWGFVCPRIFDWAGRQESSGHKRYPSLAVLSFRRLRTLNRIPALVNLNDRYEYKDCSTDSLLPGVELCSGCFLIARDTLWRDVRGFDERYFMYFEDFDLALRARKLGWLHVYDPSVRIRHAGGDAGRKNSLHRKMFMRSAWSFFRSHGWRIWYIPLQDRHLTKVDD